MKIIPRKSQIKKMSGLNKVFWQERERAQEERVICQTDLDLSR